MAYVTKDARARSPYWFANYRDATGKRIRRSTKLTSRSKALEMARALERASSEARRGVLNESRARELLSEVLQSVNGGELRAFTLADWIAHFIKGKHKSRSERTAAVYEQTAREFIEFLGPRSRLNVAAVTSKDIADFRDDRHSKGLAPATVNLAVSILSAVFSAALKQGLVGVNPCAGVEALKDKPQRKGVFSTEQVGALVKTAQGDWRGAILVGFYVGARLGDCVSLKWKNVDLAADVATIRFESQKTGAEVVCAVHPVLEDFLLSLPTPKTDDEHIFPTLAERTVTNLSRDFGRIMTAAHILQSVIRERGKSGRNVFALSFHSLRHSFASLLANSGVAEETRMLLTGHATRAIHRRYTHADLARLRDAVAVLPRV